MLSDVEHASVVPAPTLLLKNTGPLVPPPLSLPSILIYTAPAAKKEAMLLYIVMPHLGVPERTEKPGDSIVGSVKRVRVEPCRHCPRGQLIDRGRKGGRYVEVLIGRARQEDRGTREGSTVYQRGIVAVAAVVLSRRKIGEIRRRGRNRGEKTHCSETSISYLNRGAPRGIIEGIPAIHIYRHLSRWLPMPCLHSPLHFTYHRVRKDRYDRAVGNAVGAVVGAWTCDM